MIIDTEKVSWILEFIHDKDTFILNLVEAVNKNQQAVEECLDSWEAAAEINSIPGCKERIWERYKSLVDASRIKKNEEEVRCEVWFIHSFGDDRNDFDMKEEAQKFIDENRNNRKCMAILRGKNNRRRSHRGNDMRSKMIEIKNKITENFKPEVQILLDIEEIEDSKVGLSDLLVLVTEQLRNFMLAKRIAKMKEE